MTSNFDDLGLAVHYDDGVIEGESGALDLPWKIRHVKRLGDSIVVILQPGRERSSSPDLELLNGLRNLVSVGPGPTHEWTVEAVDSAEPGDGDYHKNLPLLGDRLITQRYSGRYHEFDPATGEHVDDWPADTFVVAGERLSFENTVSQVDQYGDWTVVNTGDALYGVDKQGEQQWRRSVKYRWALEKRGELCDVWAEPTMGKKMVYRVDTETGRFIKALRSPPADAKEILDLAEPSLCITGASTSVFLLGTDGQAIWQELPASTVSQAVDRDGTYVILSTDGELYALDSAGTELWRQTVENSHIDEGANGLVIERADGTRRRIDVESGDVKAE